MAPTTPIQKGQAMTDGYTVKDVTSDLGFLLSLTKMFEADSDGYFFDPVEGKRFAHRLDNNEDAKEIVLFQDPMPKGDYYAFNPFSEGYGRKSPATQFYYKTIRVAFNLNLRYATLYITRVILESKAASTAKEEYSLPSAVLRMSSVPVDRRVSFYDVVDDKLMEEFERLFDRMNDECVFVPYLKQQMTAKVMCDALTDPKWDEKFGKDIRKKSLAAFKVILMGVLGISKPEELASFSVKYDPDLKSSAQFHTIMSVYLKLYSRFNDVLADAFGTDGKPSPRDEINLGELAAVIERFPLAYAIAKHMVQPVLPKNSPTDVKAADTSRLRIGDGTTSRRFPGPEVVGELGGQRRAGGLQLGRPADGQRRFAPHVINDAPIDQFAPAVRQTNMSSGFGGGSSFNSGGGGYFNGGASGFGGGGGGLNLNPSSNFMSPGTRNSYFGQ